MITNETMEQIIRMHKTHTLEEIGEMFNRTKVSIRYLLKTRGIDTSRKLRSVCIDCGKGKMSRKRREICQKCYQKIYRNLNKKIEYSFDEEGYYKSPGNMSL